MDVALARRQKYQLHQELIRTFARAGVRLLAGSDYRPALVPSFSLHDERARRAEAGVSNADVLRAATVHPAQYLAATDSLGSVTASRLADLVLLDADPLVDIRDLQRIRPVVANGRVLDRDAFLAQANGLAARDRQ